MNRDRCPAGARVISAAGRPSMVTGILCLFIIPLLLIAGCLSPQPAGTGTPAVPAATTVSPDLTVAKTIAPVLTSAPTSPVTTPFGRPQKKLGLTVHSATLYSTLPGWSNKAGTAIVVINVSITNNLATDYRLARENIYIRSEGDTALEHGGDRASGEMAALSLRFPLTLAPGQTKTGSLIYIIFTGSKTNDLVLTDGNDKPIEKVDLYRIYTYA